MKKAIKKASIITTGLLMMSLLGFTQPAISNEKNENLVELKFIGKHLNGPMFLLNVNNSEAGIFLIKVRDIEGNLLYSEKLKGEKIARRYQVAIDPALYDEFQVQFEITSTKTNETLTYNVVNSKRAIDNIVVARL
jgi:hypothetical protein